MCLNSARAAENSSSQTLDMRVHRAADVEEQQHLHRVAPLGPHLHVEPALARGGADGAVEVEFLGRARRARICAAGAAPP